MRRFAFAFTPVESEENRCLALLAFDAEVPLCINFGPAGNLHNLVSDSRVGFPSLSVKGRSVPGGLASSLTLYAIEVESGEPFTTAGEKAQAAGFVKIRKVCHGFTTLSIVCSNV